MVDLTCTEFIDWGEILFDPTLIFKATFLIVNGDQITTTYWVYNGSCHKKDMIGSVRHARGFYKLSIRHPSIKDCRINITYTEGNLVGHIVFGVANSKETLPMIAMVKGSVMQISIFNRPIP